MIMAQSGLTFVSLLLLSIVAVGKATTRINQVLYWAKNLKAKVAMLLSVFNSL